MEQIPRAKPADATPLSGRLPRDTAKSCSDLIYYCFVAVITWKFPKKYVVRSHFHPPTLSR